MMRIKLDLFLQSIVDYSSLDKRIITKYLVNDHQNQQAMPVIGLVLFCFCFHVKKGRSF